MEHSDIRAEFAAAHLPDARLNQRLTSLVGRLAASPRASLPQAFGDPSGVEAAYRFLRNPRVTPSAVMAPHREETWRRAADEDLLLSVEDTTEMRFNGVQQRRGLGSLMNDGQGFFFHAALLVAFGDHPMPLGVAASEVLVRDAARCEDQKKLGWRKRYRASDNEHRRWNRVAGAVTAAAGQHGRRVVHVGDREADDYGLLAHLIEDSERFVFRLRFDRATTTGDTVLEILESATGRLQRDVQIASRTKLGDGSRKNKRPRKARSATLSFRASQVVLVRPTHVKNGPKSLTLNVVDVVELDPPEGEEAIRWLLMTTEAIETTAQVERIVDIYRSRWLIEEYWKALKTGCAYETRQLESIKTLENALALFIPIAWQMLMLRTVPRQEPDAPPTAVLDDEQLSLLKRVAAVENPWGMRLNKAPTAHDVALAIARMGGHLRQNGEPGWLVLRRGLDALYSLQLAERLFTGASVHAPSTGPHVAHRRCAAVPHRTGVGSGGP